MSLMNKIIEKDSTLYIGSCDVNISIVADCKVFIYQYVVDKDVSISIQLNHSGAFVEYHYSHINYTDHVVRFSVLHNALSTVSTFYNHGVNVYNKKLEFLVEGTIFKDMNHSICNQENQIINIRDGKSKICPNLFIDCYDTVSSHSAYIGEFAKEKLFYLESRGFTRQAAYHLLLCGFLITNKIRDDFPDGKIFLEEISKI